MLLVARGESETLAVRLPAGPDLTLYMEDAGIFVINGRKLPGMLRLMSICRIAISRDFFESVRPNPELSGDEADFPDKLGECLSSCLGGANFRILITLSTIFVPITTGLTSSLTLECTRLTAGTELPLERIPPLGARPLEGEHDWRLCLPSLGGSTEAERAGAAGLPLEAESGLLGRVVLRFGGASKENPGISDGFHGLDLTVGEVPREGGPGFLGGGPEPDLLLIEDEDLFRAAVALAMFDGVDGRRVGVDVLEVGRDVGAVGLAVGVEDLAVDLVGVEDLAVEVGLDGVEDLVGGPLEGAEVLPVEDLVGVDDLDGTVDLVDVIEAVGLVDEAGLGDE